MFKILLEMFNRKNMSITKITATMDDGSEQVLFPVVETVAPEPTPAPEVPKITIPLNTPVELVTV